MDWLSVIPPIVAIAVVLWRKEVIAALLLGIFASELLQLAFVWYSPGAATINTVERVVGVFNSPDNTRILIFSLMIGALLAFIRLSGGVAATVDSIVNKGVAKNGKHASLLTSAVGGVIFVESNLSVLSAGILARGLFDRFGLSRAKLAYIIDSTSAPVCILILLNGWGAFVLVLLSQYEFNMPAVQILWGTVWLNFYALVTLIIVLWSSATQRWFGPMASSPAGVGLDVHLEDHVVASKPRFMVIPLLVMILGMIGFMLWTGDGSLADGSGSKSVLYATTLATLVAYLQMLASRRFGHRKLVKIGMQGMGDLLPLVAIVLLSLALGRSLGDLGTGAFIANIVGGNLPNFLIPATLFLAGGLISFSTAILGGGVFGDHCSPISDTTAVSAIASGCDLLEHVRTQLPYALVGGMIALIMYLVAGLVML
jgi:Na+/H+ antiporter NhaC